MELYEAHLLLRAHSLTEWNYIERLMAQHSSHAVIAARPYLYSYCLCCRTVQIAVTSMPVSVGCTNCNDITISGTQQYWIMCSNIQFRFAKLTLEAHAQVTNALRSLFIKQNQPQELSDG